MKKFQLFGTVVLVTVVAGHLLSGRAVAEGCLGKKYYQSNEDNQSNTPLDNPLSNPFNLTFTSQTDWFQPRDMNTAIATGIFGYLTLSWILRHRPSEESQSNDEAGAEAVEETPAAEEVVEAVEETPAVEEEVEVAEEAQDSENPEAVAEEAEEENSAEAEESPAEESSAEESSAETEAEGSEEKELVAAG